MIGEGGEAVRDTGEFEALYRRHFSTVWNVCVSLLHDPADTEDMVHDTFLRLLESSKAFESEAHEKAWLIVTARNVCRNELKRSRRRDVPEVERADPTPLLDETLLAVRALPEKYRLPLYLFYYEGYPTADIARLLRRPDASIRSDLRRGRMLLKQALGGAEE